MLLEFSVTNFRSIKEKQTLSLLKSKLKDDGLEGNYSTITLSTGKTLDVLNSAVIYGANASGKSNFLLALQVMQDIIKQSSGYSQNQNITNIESFLLSESSIKKPTEFEIDFVNIVGVRFVYGFSTTQEKIIDEWLYQYPKGRPQALIDRTNTYIWGAMGALKGNKKLWQESTKDNSLFLSTALQLNCHQLLEDVREMDYISCFSSDFHQSSIITLISDVAKEMINNKQEVLDFLQGADVGIDDFLFIEDKLNNTYAIKLIHKVNNNNRLFDLDKESNGTQKIIALAAFWIKALNNGYCIVLDELQNSLHPKLVEYLVKMFHNPEINKNGAQLIFVTHETSLLDQDIFRRDQVWFCEKQDNATELFSLADFSVRKGSENVEKFYLSGRYGAVPYLR
ncbi:hypothetical protein SPONN_1747 [uncultured Candidatus Thioglobus sp.]|nr:hypothetical protein SPONN_1747 [uncultured Candidatus Thioglobus sp.]